MWSITSGRGVPGPNTPLMPASTSPLRSASGMTPPPTTSTSSIPFFLIARTTRGNSVPCAPLRRLRATASASSSSAIWATLSGVANSPE